MVVGIFWLAVVGGGFILGGDGWWWMVVGGDTVYNSPCKNTSVSVLKIFWC